MRDTAGQGCDGLHPANLVDLPLHLLLPVLAALAVRNIAADPKDAHQTAILNQWCGHKLYGAIRSRFRGDSQFHGFFLAPGSDFLEFTVGFGHVLRVDQGSGFLAKPVCQ